MRGSLVKLRVESEGHVDENTGTECWSNSTFEVKEQRLEMGMAVASELFDETSPEISLKQNGNCWQ